MTRVYNRHAQKKVRQRLRNDATKAERLLWWRLRGKELDGLKFRRQYGVGEFVIDLYCPAAKLAIEVDGENHHEPSAELRDAKRQAFIESFGIRVLRFTNPQVYDNLDGVMEEIWRVTTERLSQLKKDPPQSPLSKGGGSLSPLGKGSHRCPIGKAEAHQPPSLIRRGSGGGRRCTALRTDKRPPLVPPCEGGRP